MDVNKTFLETLGYSYNEIIGKTSGQLGIFADFDDRTFALERLKENFSVRELEVQVRKKSGQLIVGLFSADSIFIGEKKMFINGYD